VIVFCFQYLSPTLLSSLFHTASARESLLTYCQEQDEISLLISIPWDHVSSVDLITPSVVSLTATIHRCFTTGLTGGDMLEHTYREATVEFFVTECPASDLYWFILERIEFLPLRMRIKKIIAERTFSFFEESSSEGNETVLLSPGSEMILDLDAAAYDLETKLSNAYKRWKHELQVFNFGRLSISKDIQKFRPSLSQMNIRSISSNLAAMKRAARRICRRRTYIASILQAMTKNDDKEEFEITIDERSTKELMKKDFSVAYEIALDLSDTSEISVFDRINYLLDVSEARIRDVILLGWFQPGEELEYCLSVLVSGYYLEIIANLSRFFESGAFSSLKGVDRKKALISYLLQKDNQYSDMLISALRPVGLSVEPKPILSRLLKIDDLINDYSTILLSEMTSLVERTIQQCKAHSKEETALPFNYDLPWYPHKLASSEVVITHIPEDVTAVS